MLPDRWMGLELRHLAALDAIAEEGTFARAGIRLGYTQSAISQQIAALERIVGATLLERPPGRRPVGLTEAGELVLRHADALMARVKTAHADLEALRAGAAGELRVGTYQSVGIHVLPSLLQRFAKAWPQVEIQLRETASDTELLQLVEHGELDLTFCMLPVEEGPFETLELLRDPYVLVLPADSALARKGRRLTLKDVGGLPLIGFRSCRNEHRVEAHLRARGIEPSIAFRSDDNGTIQALVAAGVGAALMPRLTVDLDHTGTAVVDLAAELPARLLGIVWHRDRYRSPAAVAFVETATELCAELQREPQPLAAHG